MTAPDITVFVEDPGAANLVLGLRDELAGHGLTLALYATGEALPYLKARGETLETFDPQTVGQTGLLAIGTSETPDSKSFRVLADAKARGIPTVGLVDSPANSAARFRGLTDDPLAHMPDRLVVTDNAAADAYRALGLSADRVDIAMNPARRRAWIAGQRFDAESRAARREELFGDTDGPFVLFLSEISDGLDLDAFRRNDDYTLKGRGGSDARTDIVLESLLGAIAAMAPRPNVAVRLHPKETDDSFAALRGELASVTKDGDPLGMCDAADLVVGMTTTLLAETRHLGQRVLSIIPRESEREWLADIAAGDIPAVWAEDRIAPAIAGLLDTPRPAPVAPDGKSIADTLVACLPPRDQRRAAVAR